MLTMAAPVQNIPLDIVFEDDHLLVINKVSVQFLRQWLVSCRGDMMNKGALQCKRERCWQNEGLCVCAPGGRHGRAPGAGQPDRHAGQCGAVPLQSAGVRAAAGAGPPDAQPVARWAVLPLHCHPN